MQIKDESDMPNVLVIAASLAAAAAAAAESPDAAAAAAADESQSICLLALSPAYKQQVMTDRSVRQTTK